MTLQQKEISQSQVSSIEFRGCLVSPQKFFTPSHRMFVLKIKVFATVWEQRLEMVANL
jgi:hypothetical protein